MLWIFGAFFASSTSFRMSEGMLNVLSKLFFFNVYCNGLYVVMLKFIFFFVCVVIVCVDIYVGCSASATSVYLNLTRVNFLCLLLF